MGGGRERNHSRKKHWHELVQVRARYTRHSQEDRDRDYTPDTPCPSGGEGDADLALPHSPWNHTICWLYRPKSSSHHSTSLSDHHTSHA